MEHVWKFLEVLFPIVVVLFKIEAADLLLYYVLSLLLIFVSVWNVDDSMDEKHLSHDINFVISNFVELSKATETWPYSNGI